MVSGESKGELGLAVFTVTNLKIIIVKDNERPSVWMLSFGITFRAFCNGSVFTTTCQQCVIETAEDQSSNHRKQYPDQR